MLTGDDIKKIVQEERRAMLVGGSDESPDSALRDASAASNEVSTVARTLVQRRRAQQNLIDFAQFIDQSYEPFAIHRLIARKLEDVEAGRLRRLAIFVPPAVGKSRLASELFVAWVFGRNPSYEVIAGSYNKDKAAEFGSIARDIVRDQQFGLLFSDTEVSANVAAADSWKTTQSGSYKATGVAGGIIGFHAHIAIIDDPFKNYQEASSLEYREAVWNWYTGVLLNRLRSYKNGPGAVVLIMQRWHDDDLGGRVEKLAASGEEQWDILSIPSIAEVDDCLGRQPGEALLPEGPNRRTLEELAALRARNSNLFMALHQQKPVSDEGDLFNPNWLREYSQSDLPRLLTFYGSSDWALSKGSGDYTVHVVFGVCPNGHLWIVDLVRSQSDVLDGVEKCIDLMLGWKVLKWFNERTMLNKAVGPVLRKRKVERSAWSVLEDVSVVGLGSKHSPDRAGSIAGAMQLGYVHVPALAPWLGDLKWELSRFPNGRNDDQVDALSIIGQKLNTLRGSAAAPITAIGTPIVRPVLYTFNDLMNRAALRRSGVSPRRETIMLPLQPTIEWPETCVN